MMLLANHAQKTSIILKHENSLYNTRPARKKTSRIKDRIWGGAPLFCAFVLAGDKALVSVLQPEAIMLCPHLSECPSRASARAERALFLPYSLLRSPRSEFWGKHFCPLYYVRTTVLVLLVLSQGRDAQGEKGGPDWTSG